VSDFTVWITHSQSGLATLAWSGSTGPDELVRALTAAADDALAGGVRRLEVLLAAPEPVSRRAVLRSGFRLEGVRRAVVTTSDGSYGDVWLYARLADDEVTGASGFSGVMNSALPRKRVIAHVLIRDELGRVLLCETRFKADWELPGGIVEPLEPPRIGAAREVLEELGVERAIGRLLVADWMPPYLGWEDAIELIFDGGLVTADELSEFVLQPSEIKQIRLCTLDEAAELVTPLAHRRLTVATGLRSGEFAYLEDGTPVL
jgi:8-oxo-dGTP diphosphatase